MIENTQKQVDKFQDLKKATMNELLTKGIGHTKFKDSELGRNLGMSERVPEGWKIQNFGQIAKVINGYAFQSSDFTDSSSGNFPVIRMSNLKEGNIDLADSVYVPAEIVSGLEKYRLHEGDFVFGMSGSLSNYATVKKSKQCRYQNQRVGKLKPLDGDRDFISHMFLADVVKGQINGLAAGGAQLNISSGDIEKLSVPVPPFPSKRKSHPSSPLLIR